MEPLPVEVEQETPHYARLEPDLHNLQWRIKNLEGLQRDRRLVKPDAGTVDRFLAQVYGGALPPTLRRAHGPQRLAVASRIYEKISNTRRAPLGDRTCLDPLDRVVAEATRKGAELLVGAGDVGIFEDDRMLHGQVIVAANTQTSLLYDDRSLVVTRFGLRDALERFADEFKQRYGVQPKLYEGDRTAI